MNRLATLELFINQYPIVIFAKSYCPYSIKAKQALMQNADAFRKDQVLILDIDLSFENCPIQNMQELQDQLGMLTGDRTVPRVFAYQKGWGKSRFLGGGNEMAALQNSGKLRGVIRSAIEEFNSVHAKSSSSSQTSLTKNQPAIPSQRKSAKRPQANLVTRRLTRSQTRKQ